MKRNRFFLSSLSACLLALSLGLSVAATTPADDAFEPPAIFEPSEAQLKAGALATALLSRFHYLDVDLDDRLSSAILDDFLDKLDPNRVFFLKQDVQAFERHRLRLDDALRTGDLRPAFAIFNIYQTRVAERIADARHWIGSGFDYSVEENYELDRSEADWPETEAEARELWRLRIKNDKLNLRLGEQDAEEISNILTRRYDGLASRVAELTSNDAFELFMNAFGNAIEPHTGYMAPRTSENFRISMQLSLEGIGAVLSRQGEHTTIQRVVPGGPAHKNGALGEGDRITGVAQGDDGEMVNVVGWRLDDVVDLIRGAKGTVVRLEYLPEATGLGGPMETVAITRNEVKLEEQAAQKSIFETTDDDGNTVRLGMIRVPTFYLDFAGRARGEADYRSTTRDVSKLLEELNQEDIDGLVLDLRNNGGGSLDEATNLTGLFIRRGPVVQVRNSADRVQIERSRETAPMYEGPLAVLVNRNSASASEIFAAAIQDYGRGVIVGEQTYGKGTVQNLIDLDRYARGDEDPLGQLRVTTAQFFRIDGGSTQHRGVMPDIRFPSDAQPGDYGESAYENALPWTEIDALDFERWSDLTLAIEDARSRHEQRATDNDAFSEYMEDVERLRELRERTAVTLHEEKRREEMEAQRSLREDSEEVADCEGDACEGEEAASDEEEESLADRTAPDPENDLLLRETGHILVDMISFESQRLANKQNQADAS